jgi:DNA polymerase-4
MNMECGALTAATTPRWLVLDLNSFFASCEQQEQPELRHRPVAVVPTRALTTCAIAASYEAKAFGVRTGTKVAEALAMCPGLVLVDANHKIYVEYHHKVIAAIERCIPVDKVMSIDEVACRLDTRQQDPRHARALALEIKATIRREVGECLTSSIGIAGNKLLAKFASNFQKPDGLTILNPADMPGPILHQPLKALPGIGNNMVERLNRNGIHDMATLWAASPDHLRRIWGSICGVKFHALLHGADLADTPHPRRSMSHQHVLAPESRSRAASIPVLRRLTVKGGERLRRDSFYCRRLTVDVKWQGQAGHFCVEQDFQETQDTGFLLSVLATLAARIPEGRPLRVGVIFSGLVAEIDHQPDLFSSPRENPLSVAIDRLNTKFAAEIVGFGGIHQKSQSKIAFQRVPDLREF